MAKQIANRTSSVEDEEGGGIHHEITASGLEADLGNVWEQF